MLAPDGAAADAAMDALLSHRGTLALTVDFILFIGAEDEYTSSFAYSPIDQAAFDLSPTLMLHAADYMQDAMRGIAPPILQMIPELLDKNNIEAYKLTEEYIIRYKAP